MPPRWSRALAAVVLAVACGRAPAPESATPTGDPVTVLVTNSFALPVEIRAIGSGINQRLGTVLPGMSARFTITQTMSIGGSVELVADAGAASRPYRSPPMLMAPGSVVDFVVATQLLNSTATIRP